MIINMPDNSKDIEKIKDTLGYIKTKNLLGTNGVTNTKDGITYTVNDDGSITLNGKLTTTISDFEIRRKFVLPKGEYILSGCPEGGGNNSYFMQLYWLSSNSHVNDEGQGVNFSINDDNNLIYYVKILVKGTGTTFDNLTFYPMIRKADITDDTYEPYVNDSVDVRLNNILEDLKWKEIFSFEKKLTSNVSAVNLNDSSSYPTVDITPYSEIMIECKYYANSQWYYMKKDARVFVLSTEEYIGNNKSILTPYSSSTDGYITRSSEKVFTAWNFGSSFNNTTISLKIYGRKNRL